MHIAYLVYMYDVFSSSQPYPPAIQKKNSNNKILWGRSYFYLDFLHEETENTVV